MNSDLIFSVPSTQIDTPNVGSLNPPEHACSKGILPDGTEVHYDENDRVVFAHYGSGVKVVRHADIVLVTSVDGTHWFGDCTGRWFTIN